MPNLKPEPYTAKDGTVTFRVRVDLGEVDGKRYRPYVTRPTEKGCIAEAVRLLDLARRGKTETLTQDGTYSEFIALWLEGRIGEVRPKTYRNEKTSLHASIEPKIGKIKLRTLSEIDVHRWLVWLRDERKLAPSTIRRLRTLLVQTLNTAHAWKLVEENVALAVKAPIGKRKRVPVFLTDDELDAFTLVAATDDLEPIWTLFVATGARIGELLGLRWHNVHLDEGVLWIKEQMAQMHKGEGRNLAEPKTPKGIRPIALQDWAIERLRIYRAADNRKHLGDVSWNDKRFVIVNVQGKVPWAETVQHRLTRLCTQAGIRPVLPHDFRHTQISQLRAAGWPDSLISERTGHANSRMLDLYSHVHSGDQRRALGRLPRRFGLTAETVWPNDGLMDEDEKRSQGAD